MQIKSVTVSNFLGLASFNHELTEPVLFIAGDNGSGKSSLLEAIRYALTGAAPRGVTKASDRTRVITEGAASGYVTVETDGGTHRRAIASGKVAGEPPELPPNLDLCLDAPRFATMPEAERRKLLFDLAGVKMDRETIADQLRIAEIPQDVIEQILPRLREGFTKAAAFARGEAQEARGAWKATTGETYGSNKAEGWTATTEGEAPTDEEFDDARKALAMHEERVGNLREAVGRVKGAVSAETRAHLQGMVEAIPFAELEVEQAQGVYDEASAQVTKVEAEARGHIGHVQACPSCGTRLTVGARLSIAEDEAPAATPAQLNAAKAAAHDAYNELQRLRKVLNEHHAAKSTLANLPPEPTEEDLKAPERLEEELKLVEFHRQSLQFLADKRRAHQRADELAEKAAGYHRAAVAWVAAEKALGPDGIPATLLSRALDPINAALADYAKLAGWAPASIERDLTLTYGGRAYDLVSESEQWRADALFATAIAVLSKSNLLLLDRFDVLQPAARGEAIDYLCAVIDDTSIDTVIVAGTLKAKPDMGEGVDVVWLGRE